MTARSVVLIVMFAGFVAALVFQVLVDSRTTSEWYGCSCGVIVWELLRPRVFDEGRR